MDHGTLCAAAADALAATPAAFQPDVVVGFDGFTDRIVDVVATRASATSFTPMRTIRELGDKIVAASGKSSNYELVVKQTKIGGNGPIMANALCASACRVTAIGVLGDGAIEPVFKPLTERAARMITLGAPCNTDALEFHDGKIMLVKVAALDQVTWPRLVERCGGLDGLKTLLRGADGIATVNWTMTLGMTDIWRRLASDVLPGLRRDRPLWFVDLADPNKRTIDDVRAGMETLTLLQKHVDVVLGVNEAEAQQVLEAFGERWDSASGELVAAQKACTVLRKRLGIAWVVCHMVKSAAVAGADTAVAAQGFFEPNPMITTGAGDHFNAGFFMARLARLDPAHCIQIGAATSGHYVRTGQSPTRAQLIEFLRRHI
ncbi:MAG TPA: PfkB family carbohydrate kinase [Planctomycetota bacterium]|nr:PfkB family carbohydrate kinase [Planctomycetota bacterium]